MNTFARLFKTAQYLSAQRVNDLLEKQNEQCLLMKM